MNMQSLLPAACPFFSVCESTSKAIGRILASTASLASTVPLCSLIILIMVITNRD